MGISLTGPGGAVSFGAASGGKVTPINTLGTTAGQVIGANTARVTITFHNPGTIDAFVYMVLTATGAALAPTTSLLGGCFRVYANGGQVSFTGECQGAWGAFSASGSNNALTVMESNT